LRRNWAASLLGAALLLGCPGGQTPAGETPQAGAPAGAEVEQTRAGWMGRYSRKDPAFAALLSGHPGWAHYRDMALLEALQFFAGSEKAADRLGAARSYLALADLFEALDGLFLEAESGYLEALGARAVGPERARRAYVRLRLRDLAGARAEFDAPAPEGQGFFWGLGRAGVAALEGDGAAAEALRVRAPAPGSEGERVFGEVGCFLWGLPWEGGGRGPYGQAIGAFRRGDLTTGVLSLQMLEFKAGDTGADAGLFLYPLLRRAFAGLALAVVGGGTGPEDAFLAGAAQEHLGEWPAAAQAYGRAAAGSGPGQAAAWLFSPLHGTAEAAEVARVAAGTALYRAGKKADGVQAWRDALAASPGPFALALLAAAQAESGALEPLGAPEKTAAAAVAAVTAAPAAFQGEGAEHLLALYPARLAAVSRLAARVERRRGERRRAADLLDRAHSKTAGYRSGFVNPPAYLADLARESAAAGEYASAVAVLFELAGENPSARLAYESLKRLYASRTGGEAPPR